MDLTWFEDGGRPIRNYRYSLSILDEEMVSVDWLRTRVFAETPAERDGGAPTAWRQYIAGRTLRRQVWKAQVRSTQQQMPLVDSDDANILAQLQSLSPLNFEKVIVGLFREMRTLEHTITQTRYVNDKGFDFFGVFTMPLPVSYEIPFRGEAKRYGPKNGVGVGEVSRLVARLKRGEYGIFVTTSYYTQQAQEEVLEDAYPIRLFSGIDLVAFLRELKLVGRRHIKAEWLSALIEVADPSVAEVL
jgi:restriction endonuclease Mrr